MTKRLEGKVALVTGASRGLGYATALHLAKEGAHIIATARTQGGLEEIGRCGKSRRFQRHAGADEPYRL